MVQWFQDKDEPRRLITMTHDDAAMGGLMKRSMVTKALNAARDNGSTFAEDKVCGSCRRLRRGFIGQWQAALIHPTSHLTTHHHHPHRTLEREKT